MKTLNLIILLFAFTFLNAQNNVSISDNSSVPGQENVTIGYKSFNTVTTGTANIGIGAYTLESNTTGYNNVGIGSKSMRANLTGKLNTGVGYASLCNNTYGIYNTALGGYALEKSTTSYANTAIGYASLRYSTSGSENTSIGQEAMKYANGNSNVAIGGSSLYYVTGGKNSTLGYKSLLSLTTGYENVAIGNEVGKTLTTGFRNVLLGTYLIDLPQSSSYNVIVGYNLGGPSIGNNNIIIGKNITLPVSVSNAMNIGGVLFGSGFMSDISQKTYSPANGRIGINVTQPSATLDVEGSAKISSTLSVSSDIVLGKDATYTSLRGPAAGAAIRMGVSSSTWDRNMFLGFNDNNFVFTPVMSLIHEKGYVGIGTTSPDQMLTVKGKIHAQEVLIDLNGPLADYVFSPTYSLRPLNEVESFVKENNHLPEMPSAAEVKEKGLSMGEMQNKLLQKIEELTLYVIELQKTNEKQSAEIENLKKGLR